MVVPGGMLRSGRRIAHKNVGIGTADDFLPDLQPFGLKNVTLLAIGVRQQRDARRTVRIVFDADHGRGNAGLVALEVDDAKLLFVPAADKTHGGVARVAASAGAPLGLKQGLMRVLRRDVVVDDASCDSATFASSVGMS